MIMGQELVLDALLQWPGNKFLQLRVITVIDFFIAREFLFRPGSNLRLSDPESCALTWTSEINQRETSSDLKRHSVTIIVYLKWYFENDKKNKQSLLMKVLWYYHLSFTHIHTEISAYYTCHYTNGKHFCSVVLWNLSRLIIQTLIFKPVINVVQLFYALLTWHHKVSPIVIKGG